MKKILFVLITLFCFILIGCNEKQNNMSVDNKINLESKRDLEKTNQEQKVNDDEKTQGLEIVKNDEQDNADNFHFEFNTLNKNNESEHVEPNEESKIDGLEMNNELKFFLKMSYVNIINSELQSGPVCIDDVDIISYFGEYGVNGNIYVLMIKGVYMHPMSIPENNYFVFTMKQGDISRTYYIKKRISELPLIMDLNKNKIYNLLEVCNNGLLSIDEMDRIIYNYKILVGELKNEG